MSKSTRAAAVAALLLTGSLATASVAQAAPPPNDDIANATVVNALPFTDTVDTTEATITPDEAQLNDYCGAPAMEHGVWYTATPVGSGTGIIDVTASNYSAGIVVLLATDDGLQPIACGPGIVSGPFTAGQTVYFMVFGDGGSVATSGELVVVVREAVPPPAIEVTVDPVATVDRSGAATITGTVTCTAPDGQGVVLGVDGSVRQRVGRIFINGFFFSSLGIPCDGTTTQWSALAVADNGKFAGGKAATVAVSFGCGTDLCSTGYVEATVQMKKGRLP